jgi:hypothetical protein
MPHKRTGRHPGHDRPIRHRAVSLGAPVDHSAQEIDIVLRLDTRLGSAAAVGPVAAIAVRVGDRDTLPISRGVEAGHMPHCPPGATTAVQSHQRRWAVGGSIARQTQCESTLPSADPHFTLDRTTARRHGPAILHV